jgi:predicted peptidase
MPEADEILPYHVFVPSSWNGKTSLPLVFILHGNTRDQDFYRTGRPLPRAEVR